MSNKRRRYEKRLKARRERMAEKTALEPSLKGLSPSERASRVLKYRPRDEVRGVGDV